MCRVPLKQIISDERVYPRARRDDLENSYQISKKLITLSTAMTVDNKDVDVCESSILKNRTVTDILLPSH